MNTPFDALVIGGGPAGATAALLLARAGWQVALIEKSSFPRSKVCGEFLSATNFPLLKELGVANDFLREAGPPVRQIGLFHADMVLEPTSGQAAAPHGLGRALSRDRLDSLILDSARSAGAAIWQPWLMTSLGNSDGAFNVTIEQRHTGDRRVLRARRLIAAQGSWSPNPWGACGFTAKHHDADLLAFKAHFRGAELPSGLMPLFAFPGGYGGMVHTSDDRVSLSCCIRRDALERLRERSQFQSAAKALEQHLREVCRGIREALSTATLQGPWLSAGPIRPGIRSRHRDGVFHVGNAAGEAHPIIAEGIGMALQGGALLARHLVAHGREASDPEMLTAIGTAYAKAWEKAFAPRIRRAELFSTLAMNTTAAAVLQPLFLCAPWLLKVGARMSGKRW